MYDYESIVSKAETAVQRVRDKGLRAVAFTEVLKHLLRADATNLHGGRRQHRPATQNAGIQNWPAAVWGVTYEELTMDLMSSALAWDTVPKNLR